MSIIVVTFVVFFAHPIIDIILIQTAALVVMWTQWWNNATVAIIEMRNGGHIVLQGEASYNATTVHGYPLL
jgi:uncharacterized membrane protein YqiK